MQGSAGTLSHPQKHREAFDMVASEESPGPHCMSPLAHSQYYHLSVEKDKEETAGNSPVACGTLDLHSGLGAPWSGAAGEQKDRIPWPGGMHNSVAQESPRLCVILPFDLCDRFDQTQSSRCGE